MKRYVIIGNGVAAAGAIEGIRSVTSSGKITVISEENHPVYCRPLISYYLEKKTDLKKMNYRSADFYEKNGCEVIYGKKAESLNPEKQTVTLVDGTVLPYDELLIAAGSRPFVPPMEGLEKVKHKFPFMTIDDALAIEKAVKKTSKVLVIGAGLIGLKCVEGLAERAGSITVCDLAPRVLSSILDDECAKVMQDAMEDAGIKFMLSDTATKFTEKKAYMKSGAVVDFDVLILAIGVRPNTGLVSDAGGKVNRGIMVDEHLATTIPHVYAAGDCSEGYDVSSGAKKICAIMPNAYMQGNAAGKNMAGSETLYETGMPMNSIGFFGAHAMTAGTYYSKEDGGKIFEQKKKGSIRRLYTKDGYLTGFMLIDSVEPAGIYTALIRNKTPLEEVDYRRLKIEPSLASFGIDYREQKLGGVV